MKVVPIDELFGPLELVTNACRCADAILSGYLGVPVTKAERLDSPAAFDHAVAKLAAAMRAGATHFEQEAVRVALATLDVDWARTAALERRELLDRAVAAAWPPMKAACDAAVSKLPAVAHDVVGATRSDVRRGGLKIGRDFTAFDQRVMAFMTRSQTLFVRDEYGARVEAFSVHARGTVAHGMAEGLGRDDIAGLLEEEAQGTLMRGPRSYWEVVAGAFVGRARSYAQVGAYSEAGVRWYQVEAVLDERTSNICRFFHGRVFAVREALRGFEKAEVLKNSDDIKNASPWLREDSEGLYLMNGERRIVVAEASHSTGRVRHGKLGITLGKSSVELARVGLGFPPYHGLCRSTTIPK